MLGTMLSFGEITMTKTKKALFSWDLEGSGKIINNQVNKQNMVG